MANNENLKKGRGFRFQSGEEAARKGKKGGINSGIAKREKKTVRDILSDFLDSEISSKSPVLKKLAEKAGISSEKSVKELYVAVCLMNSMKKGDINDMERIVSLLGEKEVETADNGILADLAAYLKDNA